MRLTIAIRMARPAPERVRAPYPQSGFVAQLAGIYLQQPPSWATRRANSHRAARAYSATATRVTHV